MFVGTNNLSCQINKHTYPIHLWHNMLTFIFDIHMRKGIKVLSMSEIQIVFFFTSGFSSWI